MRTSLVEAQEIENYLLEKGDPANRLLTDARLQVNTDLREKAQWQARTYELIHLHGREKLRQEIRDIDHRLFHSPRHRSFQERIRSIFKI